MKPKRLYLLFAIAGFVIPYYFLVRFLLAHGPDVGLFVQQVFATWVSTFIVVDLILASVVFVHLLRREANRYQIERWWAYLIGLLAVGLSFALPWFLYARETRRDQIRAASMLREGHS